MTSTYGAATKEECPKVEMIPSEMAAPMPVPSSWMDPGSSTSGRRLSYPVVFALLLCQGARTTTYLCDDGVK